MKNIKYLALLLFSITLLISCGQDDVDSVTNPGIFTPTSEVNIGFTDANLDLVVYENDTDPAAAPITFTIGTGSNPLDIPMTLTLGVSSSDGSPEAVSYPETVTIPAGENSVEIQIDFSDDGVTEGFIPEIYTFEILDVDFGGSDLYYLAPGELTRNISVIDSDPDVLTSTGPVEITITWSDSSIDLDVLLVTGDQDLNGTVLDSSLGVTTTESVTLPSSEEGVFSLFMNEFYLNYPTEYDISFTFPDGTVKTFLGAKIQSESFTFTMLKAPIGSQVGYTLTQL
jgi:hypothetical protein